MDFNKKCYQFQQNIINMINNQTELPFLMKFYLIKQIWEDLSQMQKQVFLEANTEQHQKTVPVIKEGEEQ